ncbi:MAG: hypothetical protein R2753_17110 [Chitinophagales bacterium]
MKTFNKYLFFGIAILPILFSSCEKDDPIIPNEEELITTLIYTLTPYGGGDVKTFTFQDIDGDGGNLPTIVNDTLEANTTYNGVLRLLNESVSPADEITDEVAEEKEDHQFFFVTTSSTAVITYSDQDADGNPVGLSSQLTTRAASTGKMTIILRHEPNKLGTNVANGDLTNAGGETDIEVTFDLVIE